MTNLQRVLIIAYEFPPLNTGGTMRPVRLANHLSRRGVETCVVAGCSSSYKEGSYIDQSMMKMVDPSVKVHRAKRGPAAHPLWRRLLQSGYLLEPDEEFSRWRAEVVPLLDSVIEEFRPDVIFLTTPPFSLHGLARYLDARWGTPLVVDFRDAWSQWILTPYPTFLHYLHRLYCERKQIARSTLTTVTSQVTLTELARLHGREAQDRLLYTPNSFDEFFSGSFSQLDSSKRELNFLYLGSFYYNPSWQDLLEMPWYKKKLHQWLQYTPRQEDWSYRGPQRMLQIFDRFLEIQTTNVRLNFIFAGKKPDWWDSMLTTARLRDHCRHLGTLSKREAIEQLQKADALVITSSKVVGGADYSIAGKTFEYLACRKPILGFVCEGAQRDLLAASGAALCMDPDETDRSADALDSLVAGKTKLSPNQGFIESHLTGNVFDRFLTELERRLPEIR